MERILLVFDNRNDPNWGSQATSHCLYSMLQERYPHAEIRSLPRDAIHHLRNWRSVAATWLHQDNAFGSVARKVALRPFSALLDWPQLIVVNGEGTLHDQAQSWLWLPILNELVQRSKAELDIVNATIVPGSDRFNALLSSTFRRCRHVVLREPTCAQALQQLGATVIQAADAACLAESAEEEAAQCLQSLGIHGEFGILTGAANGRDWDIPAARAAIDATRNQMPQWVYCASTRTDRLLHERTAPDLPLITEKNLSYSGLVALIRRATIHVGGRYHPTLFALLQGSRVVAIASNTSKIQGLAQLTGAPLTVIHHSSMKMLPECVQQALEEPRCEDSAAMRDQLRLLARRNVWPES